MKKILCMLLASWIILLSGCASGEDYSSFSLEHLEQMRTAITLEILKREIEADGFFLEDKAYLIGRDLPAGKYVFSAVTPAMETRFETNQEGIDIKIFASQKKYDQYRLGEEKTACKKFSLGKKDVGFPLEIELKKNEILLVEQEVNMAIMIRKAGKNTNRPSPAATQKPAEAIIPNEPAIKPEEKSENPSEEHEMVLDHYETVEVQRSRQVLDHYETYYTYSDDGSGHFVEEAHERPVYRTEYYTETEQRPVYVQK